MASAKDVSLKVTSEPSSCLKDQRIISEYIFRGRNKDCEFVRSLEQTFQGIQKHWGLELPPVRVILVDEGDNASFDEGNVIQVPLRLFSMGEYGKVNYKLKMDSLAVAAHEYGHFVFNELWLRRDPSQRAMSTLLMRASDALVLSAKGRASHTEWRRSYEAATESEAYLRTRAELTPYTELFADVIAVSYFDNKELIFKALYFPSMRDAEFQRVYLRSFAREQSQISEMDLFEAHSRLALVRSWIGSRLWSHLQTSLKTRAAFFEVVYLHYLEESANPHTNFTKQNEDLIFRMSTVFTDSNQQP